MPNCPYCMYRLYCRYEYDLDSTRGRKRIFNTVTIVNSKLYILNGKLCGW